MNFINRFLIKCGGAHADTLERCPSEVSKFVSVGITILFTGLFATFSGGYAFYKVFDNAERAIVMGLLWGLMIFNLDRFIVMSIRKRNNKWKEFGTALPRIILAIIISLVVAKPLEVRLFQDRIEAQISNNELSQREENRRRIFGISDKTAIDSTKIVSEGNVTRIASELERECPTNECKEAFQAQKAAFEKYQDIKRVVQPLINDADRNIQFIKKSDRYNYKTIVDGEEKTEMSTEGRTKLENYRGIFSTNIEKRKAQWAIYQSKLDTYKTLNTRYKKSKQRELDTAKEQDQVNALQKAEADKLTLELEKKTSEAAKVAFSNNFITQIEALGDLIAWKEDELDEEGLVIKQANNSMFWMNIAIILLFLVIETAPIFVKLISGKGQYDLALEADDTTKESEFINVANTAIASAEQKGQVQLQILMNNQQAQLSMLQSAIKSWSDQKLIDLQKGQLTDSEYRKIIQEILDFDIINSTKIKRKKSSGLFSSFTKWVSNIIFNNRMNSNSNTI